MNRVKRAAGLCAVMLASASVFLGAQQESDRVAALNARIDRIFSTRDFALPRFGPARWLGDGAA